MFGDRFRVGDSSPRVAEVRGTLARLGFIDGFDGDAAGDGSQQWTPEDEYFDPALETAIQAFQQHRGIDADGTITDGTLVYAGDAVAAQSTTRRLLEHVAASAPDPVRAAADDARLGRLTEREREVLVRVGRGLSNHEITAELVVAEATVKTHVSRLLAKTGSRDRVQLVVLAHEVGLV